VYAGAGAGAVHSIGQSFAWDIPKIFLQFAIDTCSAIPKIPNRHFVNSALLEIEIMRAPMMQTAEEMILRNMFRAEKRGSKADFVVCLEVVFFLAGKMALRYRASDLREIAESIHTELQSITIPQKGL
jgi:hypothetical protein